MIKILSDNSQFPANFFVVDTNPLNGEVFLSKRLIWRDGSGSMEQDLIFDSYHEAEKALEAFQKVAGAQVVNYNNKYSVIFYQNTRIFYLSKNMEWVNLNLQKQNDSRQFLFDTLIDAYTTLSQANPPVSPVTTFSYEAKAILTSLVEKYTQRGCSVSSLTDSLGLIVHNIEYGERSNA
jgi:hypothetical protein